MHYLIYKTTNLVNGKYYVGKHKTKNRDDDYLGSGKLLRAAIAKYGRENFIREIILECSSEEEMNLAERILVVPDIEVNYNLCPGGQGGFGYLNDGSDEHIKRTICAGKKSSENIQNVRERGRKGGINSLKNRTGIFSLSEKQRSDIGKNSFLGKKHTDITRQRMSIVASKRTGSKNSQFGTCWMTNGAKNIKIKRDEVDKWTELGYKQGRI